MRFLLIYLAVSALVACWTSWHIHQKLDKFDWAYHKTGIWLALVLRTVFWPLMLLFKPAELLWPKFKFRQNKFGSDLADIQRQRKQFMENPPPCSSKVIYRAKDDDGKETNALFYFSASSVEALALKLIDETSGVEGLHGTAKWAAMRDEGIDAPTELPSVLVNFDYICEGLIEAGHGQVHCLACNKVYMATEISRDTQLWGGWLMALFKCPAQHTLMIREIAHFMFRRNDE